MGAAWRRERRDGLLEAKAESAMFRMLPGAVPPLMFGALLVWWLCRPLKSDAFKLAFCVCLAPGVALGLSSVAFFLGLVFVDNLSAYYLLESTVLSVASALTVYR